MSDEETVFLGKVRPVRTTRRHGFGGDFQYEEEYSVSDLPKFIGSRPVERIFHYWKELDVSAPSGWNLRDHIPALLDHVGTTADVTEDDPLATKIIRHNTCPDTGYGPQWDGMPLRAYTDWLDHAVSCGLTYRRCKASREPLLHRITQSVQGLERDYLRLILPEQEEGGEIVRIHCATIRLKANRLIGRPK